MTTETFQDQKITDYWDLLKKIESLRNCHFLLENMKNGQKKKQNKINSTIFCNDISKLEKKIFMHPKLEFEYHIYICLKNSKRTRDVK